MTVFTSAGTTLALSAAAPANYNEAGYEALTFTAIGEISDLGDIPSRVYDIVTWRNIANRGDSKAKGGYTLGTQTITVGIDPDDAGQALVDVATKSDGTYSVKISNPNLGDIYGRALVMGGTRNYGDANTIATRQITLEYTIVSQTEDGLVIDAPD
ncbi:hypothetical protein HNO88_001579 [Novosphingobium chloroacetimidivorans]|uniref:Uncharacterized protein n=1 Tax=Novosphingobium chloroacetimidivorans TaxID=1428314 RepID=A0A7W7NWK7_9SPHN|nr:hypothetical protein [Novosphingobium chloroacetimidivorans]MBB4858260.1 hypothetical protein [Novosphingobium chloroacetimidivorans]